MLNECCGCGNQFSQVSDELFCSSKCERGHNLLNSEKEVKSLGAPVKISSLTQEELDKYKNKSKNEAPKRKTNRIADWRWPQNRRKIKVEPS